MNKPYQHKFIHELLKETKANDIAAELKEATELSSEAVGDRQATDSLSFRQLGSIINKAAGDQSPVFKRGLLVGVLTAVLRGLAYVGFIPLLLSIAEKQWNSALQYVAVMTVLMLLSAVSDWFSRDYDYNGHAALAGDQLRRGLGHHLRRIPLQKLYQQRTGELAATMAGNVDDVVNYTTTVLLMSIHAVVTPIVVGLGVCWFDWRLGVIILLLFPAVLPFYLYVLPRLSRNRVAFNTANSQLNAETVEYVQGLAILKSTHTVNLQTDKLNHAIDQVHQVQVEGMRSETYPTLLLTSVVEIGVMMIVAIGLWLVSNGDLQLMILAGVMVSIVRFAEPLSTFNSMMSVLELIRSCYNKLNTFQHIQPLMAIEPTATPTKFDVRFEQVSFDYEEANQKRSTSTSVIDSVSLDIPSHAMTALVGASGSGKTTLTRLLLRYADPQQGAIYIGGVDIRQIATDQLNDLIAVVFQDVYLFDDSILANIRMGRPDASKQEVIEAAKSAQCHDFIMQLPQGYETRIGEIGSQLSGGEKQRISIARALLKDAPIVILDEPTAALDTYSEIAVQQAIDVLVHDKTVIVIAHRLSSIMAAQNIVVLESGKIVEQGRHEELIKISGRYAKLWQAQHASQLDFTI